MAGRQPVVAGNWKMHGSWSQSISLAEAIATGLTPGTSVKVIICPPFPYLSAVAKTTRGSLVGVGGQDVSSHQAGAYTGEVSGDMLTDIGCQYAIVGHSERRIHHQESDQVVVSKVAQARAAGLVPIICVGETLKERQEGATEWVIGSQLNALMQAGAGLLEGSILAYEPVWAIGTGQTATPEQAEEVHGLIRERVKAVDRKVAEALPILYGGSVKPENAEALLKMPNIDGALVGGASLNAKNFLAICQTAEAIYS